MPIGPFLGALFSIVPVLALANGSAPTIPDTPAGHALASWLDVFNSDDSKRFESFAKVHAPWLSLDQEMGLRARTGGYDLVSIEGSGKLWVVFHVKGRVSPTAVFGKLVVRSNDREHISLLGLAPADTKPAEIVLDEAERSRVVEGAARLLQEFYVFPDVAKRTASRLEAQQKRGDYRGITDGEVFAVRLSDDLTALSGDKHLGVDYFTKDMPPEEPSSRPHPDPRKLAASNCGFEKADHYPPNIGYLKLNVFAEPDLCTSTAVAAMNFLADSDTLIIDLRDNHGGAPRMAALLSSYLFDEPTHLDDVYDRKENTTEQLWTFPYMPGKKFTGKAVYVLTSNRTFSVGEEFSFDLKSLKRATLVGETTGGGAHPMAPHRIDGHFFIRVPFGRFMNPITKADWESTGVEPDLKVPAADALDEALKRARSGQ
jgi:Peptidase family S41/N-terminal domain of Peptidase_S41 in eukaryotic IRBP